MGYVRSYLLHLPQSPSRHDEFTFFYSAIRVSPKAIAAHPSDPNQLAIGLSDGGVYVLEPLKADKQWGGDPSVESSASPSINPDPNHTSAA
ncbi:putative Topless family protein [Helianthus anomalus]